MYDHIGLKVKSLAASRDFYTAVLKPLGFVPDSSGTGFGPPGAPALWLYEAKKTRGGTHVAFKAKDRKAVAAAKLDALIVLGDDQNESYLEDCRPAFAVYFGETIRNETKQHETYSHLPDWYIKNRAAFFEQDAPRDYPVHAGLAAHMIDYLMDAEFDLAAEAACGPCPPVLLLAAAHARSAVTV